MKILGLIVIGVLIIVVILRLIFKYKNLLSYKTGKIQRFHEKSEKLKLESKKKQIEGLRVRLKAARTNEEKLRLQRILDEQVLFLESMLKKE